MTALMRRRMMMQAGESWKPIATTPMAFRIYGSGVSFDSVTGTLSFAAGSTNWSNYVKLINMPYKYSDLEGHEIRVAFDYIASGVTDDYKGFVFAPNEYSTNTATSARRAGISQTTTGLHTDTSTGGHMEWSGILTTDLLTYNSSQHSASNYFGAMLAFHAPSSASATISNMRYEYL